MKTSPIVILLLFVALIFSACREITVTTKVNGDGSFTRIITITGDSTDLFRKNLPYPVNDSWLMEVRHDSIDSSLYVTYTKTFSNSEELNDEIKSDTSWRKQLDRKIDISKRFGFFYSYLTYDEVIKAANPFNLLDYKDFLTPEELQWLNNEKLPRTEADTAIMDKIEDKTMEFMGKTITAEIIRILKKGISDLNDPELNPQLIEMSYDSILHRVYNWEFDKPSLLIDEIAKWQKDKRFLKLKQTGPALFTDFNLKVQFLKRLFEMKNYTLLVEMPGIITETNSSVIKGNQVSWNVESFSFLCTDYKMHVESRVVNYWMFILTGILILLLVAILVVRVIKTGR